MVNAKLFQLATLGKYDGVICKEVLEEVASGESWTNLEDFLFALYKTVRLKGKAVLVSRLQPTLPLPKSVLDKWTEVSCQASHLVNRKGSSGCH